MSSAFDLVIVGGGPAGMAAAEIAVAHGLSVAIVDEQQRLGGQILRQPPTTFDVPRWLEQGSYRPLKTLLTSVERAELSLLTGHSVHSVHRQENGFALHLSSELGGRRIEARRLLVATGCYDMPVAFPGWTMPGVMSAGGLQAFIKAQQILPGQRVVLSGTHPLQLVLAAQILKAGGEVEAVLFAQPRSKFLAFARSPLAALDHMGVFSDAVAAFSTLMRAGVRVAFGRTVAAARGQGKVEGAATVNVVGGRLGDRFEELACDVIASCFAFIPQSDLPRALGAKAEPARAAGWRIVHDERMRTTVAGLSVAGEVAGVKGSRAAVLEGRLAGIGIAEDAGMMTEAEASRLAAREGRPLKRARAFAEALAEASDPGTIWSDLATDDTIICRCEALRKGEVAAAVSAAPEARASAIKLMSRIGMGRCQGRSCEHQLRAMQGGKGGGFTPRMPVRPVPIADLLEAAESDS